jgi:hypothetical protein
MQEAIRKPFSIPKAISRLRKLVGSTVEVHLSSQPEVLLVGILDSYIFTDRQRLMILDNQKTLRFVNLDDISYFEVKFTDIDA